MSLEVKSPPSWPEPSSQPKTYGPVRNSQTYLPYDVVWCLTKVVKRLQAIGGTDTFSVDGLATDLLRQWVKENHPDLIKLWQARTDIDEQAEKPPVGWKGVTP